MGTAAQLDGALQTICSHGAREVVLDLRGLDFIDTTGLRTLLAGHDFCAQHDCQYFIDPTLPPAVERVFALTGVSDHFGFKRCEDSPEDVG